LLLNIAAFYIKFVDVLKLFDSLNFENLKFGAEFK